MDKNIINNCINKTFYYNLVKILNLEISYPQIQLLENLNNQNNINLYYLNKANKFYIYVSNTLKKNAIDSYNYSIENNFPFIHYEAIMTYTVTLNNNCLLSTYFDQYEFTGGAHGNTIRTSESWNLETGTMITLTDLTDNPNYLEYIINHIITIANNRFEENQNLFFENYEELIQEYFNPNSFYLTSTGITFYYQHYEIGPYVSGIIEFHIPYNELNINKISCNY